MLTIIARLMNGDTEIAERFERSVRFWGGVHIAYRGESEVDIAKDLLTVQEAYAEEVWDMNRGMAKASMAWTMYGSLWDENVGWGDNRSYAKKLMAAFRRPECGCSGEVKLWAEDAARIYAPDD